MWRHAVRIISAAVTALSAVWFYAEGGFEPAIITLAGIAGLISSFLHGPQGNAKPPATVSSPTPASSAVNRSDVERALDNLVSFEEGFKFQSLAVILAKKRWPDLIASERKWDLGADAFAPGPTVGDAPVKAVACSLTATLEKIKKDAERIRENYSSINTLIFCTPQKVTNYTAEKWAEDLRSGFDLQLVVVSREDLVTSLMDPSNAALCRTHLGLSVSPAGAARDTLHAVMEACRENVANWLHHPRLVGKPLIRLRLSRLDELNGNLHEPLDLEAIKEELSLAGRLVVVAPAGAGKTTTLVQLAKLTIDTNGIPLIVDLPNWMDSDTDLLEFITRSPIFRSRKIGPDELAHLSKVEHFDFLLNGWNEISLARMESARRRLADLERDYPDAGIIVVSRVHDTMPPLHGRSLIRVRELNKEQRRDYLQQVLGGRADELLTKIQDNRTLDELTRTPLILSEVERLFQSQRAIPTNKLDILRAMAERIEALEEHRDYLQSAPLLGRADSFLSAIAFDLISKGEAELGEEDARFVVSNEAGCLLSAGQMASAPEPASVLSKLCAHHLLERVEAPSVRLRFQHQQFQEFYAAMRIVKVLERTVRDENPDAIRDFQNKYLDQPVWQESLEMIASAIAAKSSFFDRACNPVTVGVRLVQWAIPVSPLLAGILARECGEEVWSRVGVDLANCLRRWYAVDDRNHQRCALAAMLATGSSEFSDILVPLLTSDDNQVRLGAYRALGEFYLTSIGEDWRQVVNGWGDRQRADFVGEIERADVAEDFANTDPCEEVRAAALQALEWLGASEVIERVRGGMSDGELIEAIRRGERVEEFPQSIHPRAVVSLRGMLREQDSAEGRIRILTRAAALGDTAAHEDLKRELNDLTGASLRDIDDRVLMGALDSARVLDEGWSNTWIADRIACGSLWPERWIGRLISVKEELVKELLERISTEELDHQKAAGAKALLVKRAGGGLAEDLCRRLYGSWGRLVEAGPDARDQSQWPILRQLEDLAHELPPDQLVSAIVSTLSDPPNIAELSAILSILGRVGNQESDFRDQLDEVRRQQLRDLLVNAIPLVLGEDDFSGSLKAELALALARVGGPENAQQLRQLITADIERVRRGREARVRLVSGPMANGAAMSWCHWYARALTWLGADVAEPNLIELLEEPEYEKDVASALAGLVAPKPHIRELLRMAGTHQEPEREVAVDEERRARYATVIRGRVESLLEQRSHAGEPDSFNGRVKDLAGVLARLNDRGSLDLVMTAMALPGEWDGWTRTGALEGLILGGSRLPIDAALDVLNPTIEHCMNQGLYNDNNAHLFEKCLRILPFVDDPGRGIDRIRQILSSISLPVYKLRGLVTALGQGGSEASVELLVELAQSSGAGLQSIGREWIDAVAAIDSPRARELLLSFVDPAITKWSITLPSEYNEILAVRIAALAQQRGEVNERLLHLCWEYTSPSQASTLVSVIAKMETSEAVFAGLGLINDKARPPVPFELVRAIESVMVEHRPHGASGQWYTLVPRSGREIRRRLFELVLTDDDRRGAALILLCQIEAWRLDYGKPHSEPWHPNISSGEPWPPLDRLADRAAG